MVDGAFYCPAMPEALVMASAEHRAGTTSEATYRARLAARAAWRLVRKAGPDGDGYERSACPAQGEHPHLCCPLRSCTSALGQVPVLCPPKVCSQSAVTIAPDIGARHRQDLAFGSEAWARTYATYRNTIEGTNGYLKDTAHEALACQGLLLPVALGARPPCSPAPSCSNAPTRHRTVTPATARPPRATERRVTVTARAHTRYDASRRASFVAVSGLVLSLTRRTPNGIRTRAAALKGRCPRPLDDGGKEPSILGAHQGR